VLGVDLADPDRVKRQPEYVANMIISYLCDVKPVSNTDRNP
jgi:hypothetical protein